MVRWCLAVVLLTALTVGCSSPDAEEPSDAAISKGDCFGEKDSKPVPCTDEHLAETVFVSDGRPPAGSQALEPCRVAQAEYLGQDFNTRLDVQLWVATDQSWFRCDVFLRNSTKSGAGFQTLTGSLAGVLDEGVSVDLRSCLGEPYDASGDQRYVSCAEEHVAQELVVPPAIGTLKEPFPDDVADRAARACNAIASSEGLLGKDRVVRAYYPKNADAWASGERTADCWVVATKGTLPPVEVTP
jgi:hypothetical protein